MMGDKYIKELALLGVDRRKVELDKLPTSIKVKLKSNENVKSGQRDAARLLDVISYGSYYFERGSGLKSIAGSLSQRIEESKPYCEKVTMDVFNEIVQQDYHVRNDLLKDWILKVEKRCELIKPESVLELVDIGVALDKESRSSITNIIGKRGRHILTFYKTSSYQIPKLAANVWLEGSINERKSFYLEKRKEDVLKANQLLDSTWASDGQREQLAFLKIISVDLRSEDFLFLEKVYTSEYEGELIKKKGLLSSKLMVCSMLARLDYAPLISAVNSGISDYVHRVKAGGLINTLISKKASVIQLPQSQDDFWNGDYLNRLMGFDVKNMNIKLFDFDPYYWMNSFISALPFKFWTELLDRELDDVVKYFLQDSGFKSRVSGQDIAIFQDAIIFNAIATHDSALADAISSVIHGEDVHLLAPLMSQPAFEKYVISNRLRTELFLFESRSSSDQWSFGFSKDMVTQLFNMCKSGRFIPNVKYGRVMARYFHREAFEHLANVSRAQEGTQWYHLWLNNILEPIRQSILIRQRINKL